MTSMHRGQVGDSTAVPRKRVWIASLDVPHNINSKIRSKHNLTSEDVLQSIVGVLGVLGEIQYHDKYGTRLKVWASTYDDVEFVAYLYIVDPTVDHYRLGSAYEE